MSERFELPHNRSITGVTPIGYKDIHFGLMGRGKNPKVRRPILFKFLITPNSHGYPISHHGRTRALIGSRRGVFETEIWDHNADVSLTVRQHDEQRGIDLMIRLAKELL